jgi:hypothetical protein
MPIAFPGPLLRSTPQGMFRGQGSGLLGTLTLLGTLSSTSSSVRIIVRTGCTCWLRQEAHTPTRTTHAHHHGRDVSANERLIRGAGVCDDAEAAEVHMWLDTVRVRAQMSTGGGTECHGVEGSAARLAAVHGRGGLWCHCQRRSAASTFPNTHRNTHTHHALTCSTSPLSCVPPCCNVMSSPACTAGGGKLMRLLVCKGQWRMRETDQGQEDVHASSTARCWTALRPRSHCTHPCGRPPPSMQQPACAWDPAHAALGSSSVPAHPPPAPVHHNVTLQEHGVNGTRCTAPRDMPFVPPAAAPRTPTHPPRRGV